MTHPAHAAEQRPEPVLEAAQLAGRISGLILAVGACFVILGWASPQQVQTWAVAVGGVVTALGGLLAYVLPVILAKGARAQVTPLESPRTVDGTPLVPAPADPAPAPAPTPAPAPGLSVDGAVPSPRADAPSSQSDPSTQPPA
jgi:hypothetical protein